MVMKAILFDVDGTLVRVGGAGRAALSSAAAAVLGVSAEEASRALASIDFRGNTDRAILRDIFAALGRHETAASRGLVVARYLETLPATIESSVREVLPGVRELLGALDELLPDTVVGLLTGNLKEGARLKLAGFDLAHLVDRPGGFGDDGMDRVAITCVAFERLAVLGVGPPRTVVVGDTEHDVRAARAFGASAVAVATGWTEAPTLREAAPDLLLPDLSDPAGLLDLIASMT
jgi:phosphoglycolate phosphatase-like HAD superfamily hydrolase